MKVLGILAGPRKGASTDMMLDAVISGLEENGAETEKIYLYDKHIEPCKGCGSCESTQKCVIDDDQAELLRKMAGSDVIIFASPVYWCNVTSAGKKFMDRMLPFFSMGKMGPVRKAKKPSKVVLVTTCGVPFPLSHIFGVVPGCLKAMKWPFSRMQAKIRTIYCAGMLDSEKSRPSERTLAKAVKLGKNL